MTTAGEEAEMNENSAGAKRNEFLAKFGNFCLIPICERFRPSVSPSVSLNKSFQPLIGPSVIKSKIRGVFSAPSIDIGSVCPLVGPFKKTYCISALQSRH